MSGVNIYVRPHSRNINRQYPAKNLPTDHSSPPQPATSGNIEGCSEHQNIKNSRYLKPSAQAQQQKQAPNIDSIRSGDEEEFVPVSNPTVKRRFTMSGGIGMGGNSNEKDKVVSRDVQRCSANFDNENLLWDEGGTGEELEVSAAVMRREKRHREREKAKERDKEKKR